MLNGIVSHQDMLPTLLAAAGDPDVSKKLLDGYKVGNKTFKVHIDGVNVLPYITGQEKESPRNYFFYVSDDGGIMAVRTGDWKLVFAEQRATSTQVWAEPMVSCGFRIFSAFVAIRSSAPISTPTYTSIG